MERIGPTAHSLSSNSGHLRKVAKEVRDRTSILLGCLETQQKRLETRHRVRERSLQLLGSTEKWLSSHPDPGAKKVLANIRAERQMLQNDLDSMTQGKQTLMKLTEDVKRFYHELIALFHQDILQSLTNIKCRDGGVWIQDRRVGNTSCGWQCSAKKPGDGPKRPQDSYKLPMSMIDA